MVSFARRLLIAASFAVTLSSPLSVPLAAQENPAAKANRQTKTQTAIFAGGCFWCMESAFDKVKGVLQTTSGYTGGKTANPTYDSVKLGRTGHYEALMVTFDPSQVSYEELLKAFWHNIDPFNPRGQFCDTGSQYRTAIFVANEEQRRLAEESKDAVLARTKYKIVTPIFEATEFYPAEEYHQDYYLKNPVLYRQYRASCGRDQRLFEVWGTAAGGH